MKATNTIGDGNNATERLASCDGQRMAVDKGEGNPWVPTNQNAYDELMRELSMRERLYPRWVKEGKLSRTDARTRLDAFARAAMMVGCHEEIERSKEEANEEAEVVF